MAYNNGREDRKWLIWEEYGKCSLQSSFVGQEKRAIWKELVIAFVFFGIYRSVFIFIVYVIFFRQ